MPSEAIQPGKAPKQETVTAELRRTIVEGLYPPGSRLPNREELQEQFSVSGVTMQKALHQLMEDGFVYARRRGGTYVSENPPHLCNFAIVFPYSPQRHDSLFFRALAQEGVRLSQGRDDWRMLIRYADCEDPQSEYRAQLLSDLRRRRLAGLVLVFPSRFVGPIQDLLQVPCVTITTQNMANMPLITLSGKSFYQKAAQRLRAEGHRRVAVISMLGALPQDMAVETLTRAGLHVAPEQFVHTSVTAPEVTRSVARLLGSIQGEHRPTALIIADDNVAVDACQGLLAAGVRGPKDLTLISHCNYPLLPPVPLPCTFLGCDCAAFVRQCLSTLEDIRHGRPVPAKVEQEAEFFPSALS